jgi:cell division protease FtsH
VTQRKDISDATAKIIDEEIRQIVDRAYTNAREILTKHVDQLHRLAKGLLEFETLSGDEVRAICNGEPINRDKVEDDPAKTGGRRASVPNTGPGTDTGGIAPEPQPGI